MIRGTDGRGRSPKDIFYGQIATGTRARGGRPHIRFKDVFKRDLRSAEIDIKKLEHRGQ